MEVDSACRDNILKYQYDLCPIVKNDLNPSVNSVLEKTEVQRIPFTPRLYID